MPSSLRACIDNALAGTTGASLTRNVERLIESYRSGEPPTSPVLASEDDVLAYAAYRMPATYAVVHAALQRLHTAVPDFRPLTLVDFGAGTGAATWAATVVWPGIESVTLLEQSQSAIDVGLRIMTHSDSAVLQSAAWRTWRLSTTEADAVRADIAIASYVLGELTDDQRVVLVGLLMKCAPTVVLIEPGTPAGYARIIGARAALIDDGFRIVAPCPHDLECPMLERGDWCHFAERLERSRLHRVVEGGRTFVRGREVFLRRRHARRRRSPGRPDSAAPATA